MASTKKLTTEEFIARAVEKHSDKYDYSKVEYVNIDTKIIIICKEHGDFQQTPYRHLNSFGCRICTESKLNISKFIDKANKIHNFLYDYSKTKYINSRTKIIIICKIHGEFEQVANSHLRGMGCKKCAYLNKRLTQIEFKTRANEVHNFLYDYSKSKYIDSGTKITIICKIHGDFEQAPFAHINGNGCQICGGSKPLCNKTFIEKAILIHQNKYIYNKINYVNSATKIVIICPKHGDFKQSPNAHLGGDGCPKCNGGIRITKEEFVEKANAVHNFKYDYCKFEYLNAKHKSIIICPIHGEFLQCSNDHLNGGGCYSCAIITRSNKLKSNLEEFVKKANIIHNFKYDYIEFNYKDNHTKSIILCLICSNKFEQTANAHLRGNGCSNCKNNSISQLETDWLDSLDIPKEFRQKHLKVQNKKIRADAFNPNTNTIYEFYGDLWHGNPKIYNPNDKIFYGKTFGELYQKTLEREKLIKEAGYNLVSIWENDWKKVNKK